MKIIKKSLKLTLITLALTIPVLNTYGDHHNVETATESTMSNEEYPKP
jgi:hypothetical protein